MKRAVYMVVDWKHPSGVELVEGEIAQVEESIADLWHEMGVARVLGLPGSCRFCGCTQDNACIDDDEVPCHWVEADVCSTCIQRREAEHNAARPSIDDMKIKRDGTLMPAAGTLRPEREET